MPRQKVQSLDIGAIQRRAVAQDEAYTRQQKANQAKRDAVYNRAMNAEKKLKKFDKLNAKDNSSKKGTKKSSKGTSSKS